MRDLQVERWTGPIYLDTSAVVKLFVPEAESDDLNEALIGAQDVILSDLALTETASALGRRAREGLLAPAESRRLQREAAKLAASCRRAETTPLVHRRAERLLLTLPEIPLRALDALHVALALDADAATFVTYDPRLSAVAASQGLFVARKTGP
ncbi:MAG TPA: type II toxin-antitoxin system VapC family toxin [Vicinamibacteria bacterium]|nr:type II toxin-antitoxin system VapC family toxin [Vicinamibacteria bacterium]